MKLTSKGGGNLQNPLAGVYPAICARVIDLGTQKGTYEGKDFVRRQIRIDWELAGDSVDTDGTNLMVDENGKPDPSKPFLTSRFFTASLHEKANLRSFLELWRGKPFTDEELDSYEVDGFDWSKMVGAPCMLTICTVDEKGGTAVKSIGRLHKTITVGTPVNECYAFDLDNFDKAIFEKLTDWGKGKVTDSPEYKALTASQPSEPVSQVEEDAPFNDEIPF